MHNLHDYNSDRWMRFKTIFGSTFKKTKLQCSIHSFKDLFCLGISTLSSCGDPERLPELPAGDEQRLQRAALHLQQKLILREWLKQNRLQHLYSK